MKNLITAVLMTIVTTVLFGLIYPLVVTGLAQVIFPDQANGSLIKSADGTVIGSRLIGQPFSSPGYFRRGHRPRVRTVMTLALHQARILDQRIRN